jgi:hypothetical protein
MTMKRVTSLCFLFMVSALSCALISGCGRSDNGKTVSTPGGSVTVKTNASGGGGTVQVETKEGKATVVTGQEGGTVTEAQLGVPVYPGATVKASSKMESKGNGGEGSVEMHMLVTQDNFEKVSAFYKSNLKNVKNTFTQGSGEKGMAMFAMGEKGDTTVTVSSDGTKGTLIQVTKKLE